MLEMRWNWMETGECLVGGTTTSADFPGQGRSGSRGNADAFMHLLMATLGYGISTIQLCVRVARQKRS